MNHILNFFVVLFLLSSNSISQTSIIEGKITHVRDGDTLEIENIPVRLAALDCPENNTPEGR
ncbi:MAG: hypothetical protein VYA24_06285, partial [Pseudomonadota bacterium]|nr:hypothetical protein [Pseudomonadota bacterium]